MHFTTDHMWVRVDGDVATVGLTAHAAKELVDIVYCEVFEIENIVIGMEVAVIESTKCASDIYSPLSGTIIETNGAVVNDPSLCSSSPEEKGWIYKIKFSDQSELKRLMNPSQYNDMLKNG